MNATVHSITQNAPLFDADSPLYFDVCERPDGWYGRTGWHIDPSKKKLLRKNGDEPVILATVGKAYTPVLNQELMPFAEKAIQQVVPTSHLEGVQRKAEMSYSGAICMHEYTFPGMSVAFNEAELSFRLLIKNGFGTVAVSMMAGAWDWYCSNGQVRGVVERKVRRHTKGVSIPQFELWLAAQVENFWVDAEKFRGWADKPLRLDTVELALEAIPGMSKRMAKRLLERFQVERDERGSNAWALHSAFTHYATHGEIRNTGHDHAAATVIARQDKVAGWEQSKAFLQLVA